MTGFPEFDIFPPPLQLELDKRATGFKWNPDARRVMASLCQWQYQNRYLTAGYEGPKGEPDNNMKALLAFTLRQHEKHGFVTTANRDWEKYFPSYFGAAHAVLCDTVPGFRPRLFSAWDRNAPHLS